MVSRIGRLAWIALIVSLMATVLPSLHVWAQSGDSTLLELPEAQLKPGEVVDVDLNLVTVPEGVQRFHIRVLVEDPSVAQLQGISGGVISGPFFQVVSQTERSVEFRSVDLHDVINKKSSELVLATMTLIGMEEGETSLNVEVELLVSDEGNRLEPSIRPGTVTVVPVSAPEIEPATTSSQGDLSSPVEVGSYERQPQDLDGDGVPEDFDRDGRFTTKDIALFAYFVDGETIQSNQRLYDVDRDGDADIDDALTLASFAELSTASWPILRLEEKTVTIEKEVEVEVDLDLVLANAPEGLQWYDITVFVEDSDIAQVKWVDSRAIDGRFLEIVGQTADSIKFRAADLKDEVLPGAGNLLLATISLSIVNPGQTAVWLVVNPMVDDQGREVKPLVSSGSLKIVVFTIGRSSSPPMDLDGDGLFEDTNGDGKATFEDGRILSFNVSSQVVQDNWQLFDFDSDGDADFDDAMTLVRLAEESESTT